MCSLFGFLASSLFPISHSLHNLVACSTSTDAAEFRAPSNAVCHLPVLKHVSACVVDYEVKLVLGEGLFEAFLEVAIVGYICCPSSNFLIYINSLTGKSVIWKHPMIVHVINQSIFTIGHIVSFVSITLVCV